MIYDICIALGTLFFLLKKVFKRGYPLKQRLGFAKPFIASKRNKTIWVHAISLGETKVAAQFIAEYKRRSPDTYIVLTSITQTGHEEAKKSQADLCFYMPVDFSWNMKYLMREIAPEQIFLVETDFWYQFLKQAKKVGAKISLISGKISQKSALRHRKFPFISSMLLGKIDQFLLQTEEHKKYFIYAGVPEKLVSITGNMKFDAKPKEITDIEHWKEKFHLSGKEFVVSIVSTHEGEENLLLDQIKPLFSKFPKLKVFLVPRHPERFDQVYTNLSKIGVNTGRYTEIDKLIGDERLILIDTMGFVPICYRLSDVGVVAGSFLSTLKGHNILEPMMYDCALVFGPYMSEQKELERLALEHKAGTQIKVEDLGKTLLAFMSDRSEMQQLISNANALTLTIQGSLERTFAALKITP